MCVVQMNTVLLKYVIREEYISKILIHFML